MEISAYEFDSLTDLPPLPQEYKPNIDYSRISLDSLPPFPPSDFAPSSDNHHHLLDSSSLSLSDSLFLDSTLSLLNRHHLAESTRLEQIFYEPTRFDHHLFPNDAAAPFLHLPDLKSIEQTTTAVEEPKTMKLFPSPSRPAPLPAAKRQRKLHSSSSSTTSGSPTASSSQNANDVVVNRRTKISDKIRTLEKLMPWERKMSLAMILEEVHKYIKFLQSQIASLRWMPLESVYNTAGEVGEPNLLKSLTRQQILQVLANSPGSRNVLSTRRVCVFSYEQLLTLKAMSRNL
ncbi:hypothetical protein CARUB_v10016096mg [Capsella rubella]|uniref:BHLH domain-containing protein n=1 Tax=Capsella rubella TaxID=81985 RepID=R0GAQ1_9BRAS|nr:transcription factor bHLH117 [Capsella rubella]EOA32787.1 hypothetical protein CARUB_v10016096mg [Capsella rubella]